MQLSQTLNDAFNTQIQLEYASMYAYEQLAASCHVQNYTGFAHWMRVQASEERVHALKFTDFVLDRGGSVRLQGIAAPQSDLSTPLAVFEASLAHEQIVSAAIEALYEKVTTEKDFASYPLLQWFMNEQIEEESSVNLVVHRLRMAEGNPASLLMLDHELGTRVAGAVE